MRSRCAALITAGALVVGACGDDDDGGSGGVAKDGADVSSREQPFVDSLVASFTSGEDEDLQLTEGQAECVAPSWIDTIGMERIQEAELEPGDIGGGGGSELSDLGLSEADGNALYDAFGECDVDIEQAFIDGVASSGDLSADVVTCLEGQFDDDLLRRILVVTITEGDDALQNDEELTSALLAVFSECPAAPAD